MANQKPAPCSAVFASGLDGPSVTMSATKRLSPSGAHSGPGGQGIVCLSTRTVFSIITTRSDLPQQNHQTGQLWVGSPARSALCALQTADAPKKINNKRISQHFNACQWCSGCGQWFIAFNRSMWNTSRYDLWCHQCRVNRYDG